MTTPDIRSTLLLTRHGETAFNVGGRFRGRADPALTPAGVEQARALGEAVSRWKPLAVVASPRARALQTAREIAAAVGIEEVATDARFDDIDYGAWTGLTADEVAARWPTEYRGWRRAPDLLTLPEGESVRAVAERAETALVHLANRFRGGSVAIVTHDVVVRLAVCRALDAPLAAMHRIRIGLASVTVIESAGHWLLDRVNDTAHVRPS